MLKSEEKSTAKLNFENKTVGTPVLVNDGFKKTINQSKNGGEDTWQFFSALRESSDFWQKIANKTIDFAPGVDPQGNPIVMASDGNIDMRMVSLLSMPKDESEKNPILGMASIQTGNTTTSASMIMAFTVRLASMPAYIPLSKALLGDLVKPLYSNMKTFVGKMSSRLSRTTSVGEEVDATSVSDEVIAEQNQVVEEMGEEGLEYVALDWSSIGLEIAGMAPLVALPMILEYLGHQMYHSLYIQNLTNEAITWSYEKISGKVSLSPGNENTTIPAQMVVDSIPDIQEKSVLSYQANFQFINSNDYGDITYVMSLQLPEKPEPVKILIYIPWAGENVIWAGVTNDNTDTVFEKHSTANGDLSLVIDVYDYQLTLSLNALSGKTVDDNYFYCSTAVLEPK